LDGISAHTDDISSEKIVKFSCSPEVVSTKMKVRRERERERRGSNQQHSG
jgi:hypothetical protein